MHEMGLAEAALDMVLDAAAGESVKRIRMRVGKFLLVVPDSFQFSFELASAGSNASGAAVEIEETPVKILCHNCQATSDGAEMPFLCGHCSSTDVEVVSGEDMVLEEIELENGTIIRNRNVNAAETLAEHFRQFGPHQH